MQNALYNYQIHEREKIKAERWKNTLIRGIMSAVVIISLLVIAVLYLKNRNQKKKKKTKNKQTKKKTKKERKEKKKRERFIQVISLIGFR